MYRHAHARIGPIVRRVRNPPIRIAYIYPCDSAGCQNELLCTNSQTDYIDGFEFRQRVGRLQRRLHKVGVKFYFNSMGYLISVFETPCYKGLKTEKEKNCIYPLKGYNVLKFEFPTFCY